MKYHRYLASLLFVIALALTAGTLRAQDDQTDQSATFQNFYDQLGDNGTWIQTDNYGYVFQPQINDPNWQPYTDGHWVYTDAGWTWVSAEPWGWATYHYGRWVNLDGVGWCWVPGYTWAPAWVSWRYGGGYCGWAPLPPDTEAGIDIAGDGFDVGVDFHIGGDCDTAYGIGPEWYNFCPVAYLGASDYRPYYRNRYDNFALINNTVNVTNIYVHGHGTTRNRFGRVTVGGPDFAAVNSQSHTPVARARLTQSNRVGASRLSGSSLAVYAPHVRAASGNTARPHSIGAMVANPSANRGTDIHQPLAVNSHLRAADPTEAQMQAASAAPAGANVATSGTHFSRALNRPLTSYQHTTRTSSSVSSGGTEVHANSTLGANPHSESNADQGFTGEAPAAAVQHHKTYADQGFTGEAPAAAVQHHKTYADQGLTGEAPAAAVQHHKTYADQGFTGEAPAATVPHHTTSSSAFSTGNPSASGFSGSAVHHENTYSPENTVVHHEAAPVQHTVSSTPYEPAVVHHDTAPVHPFVSAPHPSAPPPPSHPAPPPAPHPSAPPPHPAPAPQPAPAAAPTDQQKK